MATIDDKIREGLELRRRAASARIEAAESAEIGRRIDSAELERQARKLEAEIVAERLLRSVTPDGRPFAEATTSEILDALRRAVS